jgi:hypothetical protein
LHQGDLPGVPASIAVIPINALAMPTQCAIQCTINVDLADVWRKPGRKELIRTVAWGDEITVLAETTDHLEVEVVYHDEQPDGSVVPRKTTGYIRPYR